MQVSYGEGVAIHAGPELCVASRKAGGESSAGVRAGQVFSPKAPQLVRRRRARGPRWLSSSAWPRGAEFGIFDLNEAPIRYERLRRIR
jgi:hypothetical protein